MFELYWPWVWLLLPLPLAIIKFWQPAVRQKPSLVVPFFSTAKRLTQEYRTPVYHKQRWANSITLLLIWLCLLFAASNPRWSGDPLNLPSSGRDLMLAVDLSASMEVEDMQLQGQPVSRLDVTQYVVSQFIRQRQGDRLGLIFFGSHAYLQTPLTFDLTSVQTFMEEAAIGMAGRYTAIGDAIGLASRQLRDQPSHQRVMILLTDGANTTGAIQPQQAAEVARKLNIKIYSIGIGAEEIIQPSLFGARRINPSANLDEALLQQIAEETGGHYFRVRNTQELEQAYKTIEALEPLEIARQIFRPYRSLYQWPLAFAMLASLILFLQNIIRFSNIYARIRSYIPQTGTKAFRDNTGEHET